MNNFMHKRKVVPAHEGFGVFLFSDWHGKETQQSGLICYAAATHIRTSCAPTYVHGDAEWG
jgi:hypothetical protein